MWRTLLLTISVCGLIAGCTMLPEKGKDTEKANAVVLDNFERDMQWKPVSWSEVNKCDVEKIAGKKEGHLLSVMSHEGKGKKIAIKREFEEPRDFSQYTKVTFDAKVHGDEPLSLAMAIMTDAYYETPKKELQPGWNKDTTFVLTKDNFKSEEADWKHTSALKQAEKVNRLYLLLYTKENRHIEIDNLRGFQKETPN